MMTERLFPADSCLKCSTCNTVCPVYAVNPSFRGPKFIGPESTRLVGKTGLEEGGAAYCTGCRQCELACPAGVPITQLAASAKARQVATEGIRFRDWLLGHNQWLSGTASRMALLANGLLGMGPVMRGAEAALGIKNRPFPRFARPFPNSARRGGAGELKVVYFAGCYASYNRTTIAQAAVDILRGCGIETTVVAQKCCGVPLLANGLETSAKKYAARNLEILLPLVRQGCQVVLSCPSCTLSLKDEYRRHFRLDGAAELAASVWDISDYLLAKDLLAQGTYQRRPEKLYYHQPCHTKVQGINTPARELLVDVPGLEVAVGEQKCCGQSGTYGFKKEKYLTSQAIAAGLFREVAASGAVGVVTDCGMCGLQLAQGTGLPVYHPLEVLRQAMTVPGR